MTLRKKKPSQSKGTFNKTKSFSMISAICLIGTSLTGIVAATLISASPLIARGYDSIQEPIIKSSVVLTKSTPRAIVLVRETPGITPGESTTQREAREKAEAEATAKASALAAEKSKKTENREVVTRERRVYTDPVSVESVYVAAGERFGVDPRILKAIHYVETGCSGSSTISNPSGATGPMQFLPSTFRRHAVDGNGDGVLDVHNLEDAVFTAAEYLRACGYPNIRAALYGYNPSTAYYYKVMDVAVSLGFNQ